MFAFYAQGDAPESTMGNVISINFSAIGIGEVAGPAICDNLADPNLPGDAWNNFFGEMSGGVSGTETLTKYWDGESVQSNGTAVVTWNARNMWSDYGTNSAALVANNLPYLIEYLDDGSTTSGTGLVVTVTGIPYNAYDVILYTNTDTQNSLFRPFTVNGISYSYTNGATVVSNADWGRKQAVLEEGKNALRINGLTGTLSIVGNTPVRSSDYSARGCLAAIQIVENTTAVVVPVENFKYFSGAGNVIESATENWWEGNTYWQWDHISNPCNVRIAQNRNAYSVLSGGYYSPGTEVQWTNMTAFTTAYIVDVTDMATDDKWKIIAYMGGRYRTENALVLFKDPDGGVSLRWSTAGVDDNTEGRVLQIPASEISQGYHLFTVTCDMVNQQTTLRMDDGAKRSMNYAMQPAAGFQIGSAWGGYVPATWGNGNGLGVYAIFGWEQVLTDDQVAALYDKYSFALGTPIYYCYDSNFNNGYDDGILYVPTMTSDEYAFRATRGTIEMPTNSTVTVPSVCLGNAGTAYNYTFNVRGTMNVTSVSTTNNVYRERCDNNGVGGRGILFGHWAGTGVENIYGTLNAPNCWLETTYTHTSQVLNIDGGKVTVRGIYARNDKSSATISNGGVLEVGEFKLDGNWPLTCGAGTIRALSYDGSQGITDNQTVTFTDTTAGTTLDPNGLSIEFSGAVSGSGKVVIDDQSANGDGTVIFNGEDLSGFTGSFSVLSGALLLPKAYTPAINDATTEKAATSDVTGYDKYISRTGGAEVPQKTMIANMPYVDGIGDNSSGRYRIPALAKGTNGVMVAAFDLRYNGTGDLPNAIDIAECRSGDGGLTWEPPRVGIDVANTNHYSKLCDIGDPCMLYDPAGEKFWLMGITGGGLAASHSGGVSVADVVLYTRGAGRDDTWQEWSGGPAGNPRSVKQMILDSLASVDSGASSDEDAIRGILQGPGHGIVQRQTVYAADGSVLMPAGALVFPMQYFPSSNFNYTHAFAAYSTDGGNTWQATKLTPGDEYAQENCVMELDDGSWYMICKGKTQSQKQRQLFRTTDYRNWTYCGSITPSEWVQGSSLKLGVGPDGTGRYAACFSPSGRSDITLHFGRDTTAVTPNGVGVEWDLGTRVVYEGSTGGMGYNSLAMLDDRTLGILLEADGHIYMLAEDVGDILAATQEVVQTEYAGLVTRDAVDFDSVIWTGPVGYPDAGNSFTTLSLTVATNATITVTNRLSIGTLVLKGDSDLTLRMAGDGAFYPGAIDTSAYGGTLSFVIGDGARLGYYLGYSAGALSAPAGADYLPFLAYDTEIERGGTIAFTYATNTYCNAMSLDFSRLTGDGLVSLDNVYDGRANWIGFPERKFADSLSFYSDADIVMSGAFTLQNMFTVYNLSGGGRFRSDWDANSGMRGLRTIQTANTVFSGRFMGISSSIQNRREIDFFIAGEGDGPDYANARLVLNGEGSLIDSAGDSATFHDSPGTLTVESNGALEIDYMWGGPAEIYGAVGGVGGFSSNLVFHAGCEFVCTSNTHLTATGSIEFPTNMVIRMDSEPDYQLVLDIENATKAPDVSNTELMVYVNGEPNDKYQLFAIKERIFLTHLRALADVKFDLGEHGKRTGGGELEQIILPGNDVDAPEFEVDWGWRFAGWSRSLANIQDAGEINISAIYDYDFALEYDEGSMDGCAFSARIVSLSDYSDISYSAVELPSWLTIRGDGTISGTPELTGESTFSVAVGDGNGHSVVIPFAVTVVENPNHRPTIGIEAPSESFVAIRAGEAAIFSVTADDSDGDELTYIWTLDESTNTVTTAMPEFVVTLDEADTSLHTLSCAVTDGFWTIPVTGQWTLINAYDVNFDIGEYGVATGGGETNQLVVARSSAVAPIVQAADGYDFDGWDEDISDVVRHMTVHARYVRIPQPVSVTGLNAEVPVSGSALDVSFEVACDDPVQTNYIYLVARDEATGAEYPVRTTDWEGEIIVTNGTYRLSWNAAADIPPGVTGDIRIRAFATGHPLAHRWGFNGNYLDTAGTMDARAVGNVTLADGRTTLAGGANGTSYVLLGREVFPGSNQPRTVELWARQNAVVNWSRIFDFGRSETDFIAMGWTSDRGVNEDFWRIYGIDNVYGFMSPYSLLVDYHIVMVLNPLADGNWDVTCYKSDVSTGEILNKCATNIVGYATLIENVEKTLYLGRSFFSGNYDAAATYDEVRIWNAALRETELTRSVRAGADTVADSVASGPFHVVTFDLGGYAMRTGGGELVQVVTNGMAAVAPDVSVDFGWLFTGWSMPFTNITASIAVEAQYESAFALGETTIMDGVAFAASFENRTGLADITWSSGNLPEGLTLSPDGTISGVLQTTGIVSFTVTASLFNGVSRSLPISLDVAENPNHRPVIAGTAPTVMPDLTLPRETLTFNVAASDPDGDALSYVWLIDGVTNAVNTTGVYNWTPEELDGGTRTVTCLVTDGFWYIPAGSGWRVSIPKWYVSGDGVSTNVGTTATTAFREIQSAVDVATEGDVIFVAEGVYGPINTANKRIRVIATGGLDKTIIDGGGTNRCVYVGDEWQNYIPTNTNTYFKGFTIRNGYASDPNGCGGGVSGGSYERCVLEGNRANGEKWGGAAFRAFLYNCLLVGNSAAYGGAADSSSLYNCTVVSNTASSQGGGIYNVHARNTIVWGNVCTAGNSFSNNYNGISATIVYSCIAPNTPGTGNINTNPYFADPANGDYRLQQYSPCLDAGNNSYVVGESDLSGTNRMIDGRVDMGCYEGWVYLPVPAIVEGVSAGDGTRIGIVRLTWEADEYARTYKVYRALSADGEGAVATQGELIGETSAPFFDDETATPETTYWYWVKGVNPAGEGAFGDGDSGWCMAPMEFGANDLAVATVGLPYHAQLAVSGGSGSYAWTSGADDYDVDGWESTYLMDIDAPRGLLFGDDVSTAYPLPFDFPFYGKSYNKLWISSNGTLTFDGDFTTYSPSLDTFKSRVMIVPFWKDLLQGNGGVYVSENGNESVTFLWYNGMYYSGHGLVNASVTLFSDGSIVCSYGDGNANGAFVGISAGDGTRYRYFDKQGTSLDNADDIVFIPQDVPGGLTLGADGVLSGTPTAPGEYVFTVFVTDEYGNGATRQVSVTVEENPNMRIVSFDLGEYGVRGGGGELRQYVLLGESAVAPTVRVRAGWVFDGWTGAFTNIADSVTVAAKYRSAYADLHVDSVEVQRVEDAAPATGESQLAATAGDTLVVSWTVGNTGNPAFAGKMTEYVRFVDAANPSNVVVVAVLGFEGTLARDGTMERSAEIALPLKGLEGEWIVEVETAANPSVREYTGNNTRRGQTVAVAECPLPDLVVRDVMVVPESFMPGDTVTVTYVDANVGGVDVATNWLERIALEDAASVRTSLVTVETSASLPSGAGITNEVECVIPELVSLAGEVRLVVETDFDNGIVEVDDAINNVARSGVATLGRRLYLTAASDAVRENVSSGVRFTVRRSGPTAEALEVEVRTAGGLPSAATVTVNGQDARSPGGVTVTIPAGNGSTMFTVAPIDNATVEGARTVDVSAAADGFSGASVPLTILDDEVPRLTVTFDKTSIREGDGVIIGTVTRELVTDEPLTVYLSGASTSRSSYPSSVTIPAGEASVTFEISVPNNDTAQTAADLTLRASASGYTAATQSFTVEDDDVPGVTLSLTPEIVSEGAGAQAIYATLTRSDTTQISKAVTVRLTASEANQLILPSTMTIPAYTMAVRFAVGVVDNALDDGDREVEIDGAVVIESCGCDGQPSNGDVIQAVVGIIDNDGPALALRADPTTMKEGLDPAGYLVLSHNSTLTEDLTVRLWVDAENEDEVFIPETVTIPSGQTSVRIPVKTLDDGVEDGGQLVSVYAEADGDTFAPASTWVQVSDQNLPDLMVANVELSKNSIVGKSPVELSFTVKNCGFMKRMSPCPWGVYVVTGLSTSLGDATLVASGATQGGLDVSGEEGVTLSIAVPERPGTYRFAIVADPDSLVAELDEANNTAWSEAFTVTPSYTATVAPEKDVYLPGERIFLRGAAVMADGVTAAGNVDVEVYVLNSPYRRTYTVRTDARGVFEAEFLPVSGEGGHYTVGASYPNISATAGQAIFDILGMRRTSTSYVEFDMFVGDSRFVNVPIRNLSSIPLTGMRVICPGSPEECELTASVPDSIPGGGTVNVRVDVQALSATPESVSGYRKLYLNVVSEEGVSLSFPVYVLSRVYVPPTPEKSISLSFSPASVSGNMAVGETLYREVVLENTGKDTSGEITLNVPTASWLRAVNGKTLPPLAAGERVTVVLELTPGESLTLNAPISGKIQAREDELGRTASLNFSFTPVSSNLGCVRISPVDEYTYYQNGAPHIAGVSIAISNPYTQVRVASGVTDGNGEWLSPELPCGVYDVYASEGNHASWSARLEVEAESVNSVEPFMSFEAVKYKWDVKRVEVDDVYEITLLADFVTSVPKPTVLLEVPGSIPQLNAGESYAFSVTAVNHGLIAARNVRFSFPENFPYQYEFAVSSVDEIPAKSSVIVPVVISVPNATRAKRGNLLGGIEDVTAPGPGELTYNPCSYGIMAMFEYLCGPEIREVVARSSAIQVAGLACDVAVTLMQTLAQSFPASLPGGGGDPVPGNGGGGGGGGGGGEDWLDRLNELPPYSQDFVMTNCIMGLKILECLIDRQFLGKFNFKETLGTAIAYNRYGYGDKHDVWEALMGDLQGAVSDVSGAANGDGGGSSGFSAKDLRMIVEKTIEDKIGGKFSLDDLKKVLNVLDKALCDELSEEDLLELYEDLLDKYVDSVPLDDFFIDPSDLGEFILNMLSEREEDDDDDDDDDDDGNEGKDDDGGDSCSGAVDYYFKVYKKAWEAELSRRKAEREAASNGTRLLGAASSDGDGQMLDELCAPEVQDDAAVAAAGVVYVYTSWRKLVYMLGEGEWVNDAHVFTFPQYMRAAYVNALLNGADSNRLPYFGDDEAAILKDYVAECGTVSEQAIVAFIERWNRTVEYWNDGKFTKASLAEGENDDFIDADVINGYIETLAECQDVANIAGRESLAAGLPDAMRHLRMFQNASAGEVCARVSIKFNQTVTIAREAFEGTLTVYNGHDGTAMENVRLSLTVTDVDGNVCNDLFGITERSLDGFSGYSIRDGGVSLAAKGTGIATILFVPTAEAAPTAAKVYYFGGKMSYVDPFSGAELTVTLAPVALMVNPCPKLSLHYFLQQEVFGDDPFTPEVIEPSELAELALLVVNSGAGEATRLTVRSAQPEKFMNEKGQLVDFNLSNYDFAGARVNGVSGGTLLETDLGTIPANGTAQAQWWLTSSVQGRFTGMSAQFMQVNNWGNPKTCLIDATYLHPLVKSVSAGATDLPDFLVSEDSANGVADALYLDDGTKLNVGEAANVSIAGEARGTSFNAVLRFTASDSGAWYGEILDPGEGNYTIAKVVAADGTELPTCNFWLRDRGIAETGNPVYGYKLHFFAMVTSPGVHEYVVTFVAKPSDVPEVAAFEGVANGAVEYETRDSVTVVFSKPIDPATFTVDDLTLMKQGAYLNDLSAIAITPTDDSGMRFTIGNLAALCGEYGRYELTVQCAGVADAVGQLGTAGKSVAWTYSTAEAPYVVGADGVPTRRIQSLDAISVTFSAPVDPATFTPATLRMNNAPVGDGVTISALDATGTRFSVSGLSSAQTSDGEYTLIVDATAVTGLDGTAGVDAYTATWTRDTVAPVLQSLTHEDGLNGNEFTLTFSEEVESESLTPHKATLKRDNSVVALPDNASLRRAGDGASCQWILYGIDAALVEDGTYELTFSADGVTDEAGNVASGSNSVSWTVDRTPPAQITDLAISPDGGFSDTDGITYTGSLTVSGTLPEAGLTVEIIAKYVGGGETVLATLPMVGGDSLPADAFSQNIVMPGTGNATLVVRLTDAAGNSSDSEKSVSVDGIALTGTLTGASDDEGVVTTTATLAFSAKPMETDVTFDKFSLTRDGEAVALEGATLRRVEGNAPYQWELSGLDALCAEDGVYVLTFNGAEVRKYSSGLLMSGSPVMRWRYENPDREPPTVMEVLFDGETPHEAYTNVFSSVSVTFSEAVNVPELIDSGLIGKAARIDLLDVAGAVTAWRRCGALRATRPTSGTRKPMRFRGRLIRPLSRLAGRGWYSTLA